ncbi:MAG TPA: diguanylate cyclase [bacterium]|nr:diguanylate cyclase [bacterium]
MTEDAGTVEFTVADAMTPSPDYVTPRDTVATAAKIMTGHSVDVLPVMESGRVVGLITAMQLLAAPAYRPVADVMTPGIKPVTPDLPLVQAYAAMMQQQTDALPVVREGTAVGYVAATAVLRKQGQQNDPLTGLPASTALRAWAMAALDHGHEISMLFIDLDNFGAVNKLLGHVTGDDLLRAVARLAASLVDNRTDLLSRYGGDEFVVATTRDAAAAGRLRDHLQTAIALPVAVADSTLIVTASIGLAGGRRAENRERTHVAATVDDLLTLASRASTLLKEAKRAGAGGSDRSTLDATHRFIGARGRPITPPHTGGRVQIVEVAAQTDQAGGKAVVRLRYGSREGSAEAVGPLHGHGLSFLAAQATLEALRRTTGETTAYVVEELSIVPTATEKLAVVVLSAATGEKQRLVGICWATDVVQAVPKAILNALNRRLGAVLGGESGSRSDTSA